MIKVMQTIVDDKVGNCFQACVASIFELPLDEVPHFLEEGDNAEWWDNFNVWLEKFRLKAINFTINKKNEDEWITYLDTLDCLALAGIKSDYLDHCVVIKGSKIVHNPFPGYSGRNDEKLIDFQLIVSMEPSKLIPIKRVLNDMQ